MKKLSVLLFTLIFALSLASCGTNVESDVSSMGDKVESRMDNR